MQDSTTLTAILVVLTVGTLVQAAALVGAFLSLRRMEVKLATVEREFEELKPRIEKLGRTVDIVAEWTERAAERAPRVAQEFEDAVERAKDAARLGALMLVKPLRPIGALFALWRGVKQGVRSYRALPESASSR
jgi:hypothetical protein